jgi:hypothetical protein
VRAASPRAGGAGIAHLAALIGDNLVPIAGVLLLGWSAPSLVTIYFAGFLLDVVGCVAVLWALDPEPPKLVDGPDTPLNRLKGVLGVALAGAIFLAIIAAVMGFPLFIMFAEGSGVSARQLFTDRAFLMALALHLLLAAHAYVRIGQAHALQARKDPAFKATGPMRARFNYVAARWVVVYAASFFLAIPAVLVVAYSVASIWFELKPPKADHPAG